VATTSDMACFYGVFACFGHFFVGRCCCLAGVCGNQVYKLLERYRYTVSLLMSGASVCACRILEARARNANVHLRERLLAGSDKVHNASMDTAESSSGVYTALIEDLKKSVEGGFINKVVGSKLATLLFTLHELRKEEVVCIDASPGNNCILGSNALTVKNSEKFCIDIANLLKIEDEYHGKTLDEQTQWSVGCVYQLFAAIGMIIEHTGRVHKAGAKMQEHEHPESVRGMPYDAKVFASNRGGMTAGV